MLVDIDYILSVKKRLRQINAEDIENITWIKDGEVVVFDKKDIEDFEFMGLNNTDILVMFKFSKQEE